MGNALIAATEMGEDTPPGRIGECGKSSI